MKKELLFGAIVAVGVAGNIFASVNTVPAYGDVRLRGPVGDRLDKMIQNHVTATDIMYITDVFKNKAARVGTWRSEFWGKYMHSAMPYWSYTKCPVLKARIDAGLKNILSTQMPEGYIGDYSKETRAGEGWDVWGMKYTMLGLLHYYDETGDKSVLDACSKLCDFMISEIGPNGKRPYHKTGNYAGLASCSALEPVMWLYNRTKNEKYLDFAKHIVKEMTEQAEGPQLFKALKDIPVADRDEKWLPVKQNGTKSYEMMSCYQGLIEFYEVTGDKRCLDAAVKAVESIVRDELNICGGSASSEHWFHGAKKQYLPFRRLQETCVTTTWLRLCGKLLEVTGDSKYADFIEQTFYNAYLAAMKTDGTEFAGYTPLNGVRYHGQHHCSMHTDCCNSNGPRGFLAFLRGLLQANEDAAIINFYASSRAEIELPKQKETVTFETYTLYPREGNVVVWNRTMKSLEYTLKLRIPGWCEKASVKVNGKAVEGVKCGSYVSIKRTWNHGDKIDLYFDMPVKSHLLDHHIAFTRGPVVLARDARFNDGPIDDVFRPYGHKSTMPNFFSVRSDNADMWMTFCGIVQTGSHSENPEARLPAAVKFCDYSSAGNTWDSRSSYRIWFPIEWGPDEK